MGSRERKALSADDMAEGGGEGGAGKSSMKYFLSFLAERSTSFRCVRLPPSNHSDNVKFSHKRKRKTGR